jgi:hypothetical protein
MTALLPKASKKILLFLIIYPILDQMQILSLLKFALFIIKLPLWMDVCEVKPAGLISTSGI